MFMEDLKNVLKENLEYYKEQERIIVGFLSSLPKGRIRKRKINGDSYYYLQFRKGKKIIDKYIGKEFPDKLAGQLKKRNELEKELKEIRKSIKLLTKEKQESVDMIEPVKNIFEKLSKENLWEEGFEIIGSWCFMIYQKYLDFPRYPLKTDDLDILIPLPYKGKFFDLSFYLKSLGFIENFNPNGSTYYSLPNLKIEFLSPQKKDREYAEYIKPLGVSPQQLKFLEILQKNPVIIKISKSIKIKVPSPSSFFLHKLLIAKRRREKGKKEKDLKQAIYTGKYILSNQDEIDKLNILFKTFSKSWKTKIINVLKESEKDFLIESETIRQILKILFQHLPYKT